MPVVNSGISETLTLSERGQVMPLSLFQGLFPPRGKEGGFPKDSWSPVYESRNIS